jgi:hypothetical protein
MHAVQRCAVLVAAGALLGCGGSSDGRRLEVPREARVGLRADAVGCWDIRDAPMRLRFRGTWWLPERLRLDTARARHINARGHRVAWRLDKRGERVLKDGEGFALFDTWTADSASDRITITTSNGLLYGAIMVLSLSSTSPSSTMSGHGQEYGDVFPQPDVPIVPVHATRVECNARSGNAGGV